MPENNGTGPEGKGPMTGKGRGNCVVNLNTYEEEINYLQNREEALKRELKLTRTRMKKLKDRLING
jgi:hypothetical protein